MCLARRALGLVANPVAAVRDPRTATFKTRFLTTKNWIFVLIYIDDIEHPATSAPFTDHW
jgi:hypothetical protein